MDKDLTPPKPGASDLAHAGVRSVVGAIPFAGATGIEIFNAVVKPPYEKRLDCWRRDIGEAVSMLKEEKGLNIEDLSSNEFFIDIITQATQTALKTSQSEKRDALKNAVLNTAMDESPDESLNYIFLRFIDEFTVWHLKAIQLVYAPEIVAKQTGTDVRGTRKYILIELMFYVYPKLKEQEGFIKQVLSELHNRGLMIAKLESVTYLGSNIIKNFETDLGRKFYDFITFS